jgi:hypothetical protein
VEVSVQLPPQIVLLENVIEVQGEKESYKIDVKPEQRDDGSARISFKDVLSSGGLVRYTLQVLYKADKEQTALFKTVIQPLDEETAATVTALEAITAFEVKSDLVTPLGTYSQNAQYVDEWPKELR